MEQSEGKEKENPPKLVHKLHVTESCSGVTGFTFIFEATGSWLPGIPDLNLLESGVSRTWETAQMCAVRLTFWIDSNSLKGRVCVCPLPFFSLLTKYNQRHKMLHSQFMWGLEHEGWFLAALLCWWCLLGPQLTDGKREAQNVKASSPRSHIGDSGAEAGLSPGQVLCPSLYRHRINLH